MTERPPTADAFEQIRSGIRLNVCQDCGEPLSSNTESADTQAKSCESQCDIFLLMPRLCELVKRHLPDPPCGYEMAVHSLLRHVEESQLISPEPLRHRGIALPLLNYADATLAVIERVLRHQDKPSFQQPEA